VDTFDTLNDIYAALNARAAVIRAAMQSIGVATAQGFYNNHYVKRNGAYVAEAYPIPVLTAGTEFNIGREFDIGVDLNETSLEFHIPREKALALDYPALMEKHRAEVYGAEEFLGNFEEDGAASVAQKIAESDEETVCVCLFFAPSISAEEIAAAAQFFRTLQ